VTRFVYIGDQVNDDTREFAFYDTITDRFVEIAGDVTFDSIDDFGGSIRAARRHPDADIDALRELGERLERLIPQWYRDHLDPYADLGSGASQQYWLVTTQYHHKTGPVVYNMVTKGHPTQLLKSLMDGHPDLSYRLLFYAEITKEQYHLLDGVVG
jgi:hypothetical protein